ncbi:747_t:CDS:2, partial [Gigaspora rosea]
ESKESKRKESPGESKGSKESPPEESKNHHWKNRKSPKITTRRIKREIESPKESPGESKDPPTEESKVQKNH